MGKYMGYHLTVGPGDRDPDAVAGGLSAELTALPVDPGEGTDWSDLVEGHDWSVWIADGLVHWNTGRRWDIAQVADDFAGLVEELSVPAEWAVGVWEQEVEAWGVAHVFAWVDGEYVLVDEQVGQYGCGARDALDTVEREWGVEGGLVT